MGKEVLKEYALLLMGENKTTEQRIKESVCEYLINSLFSERQKKVIRLRYLSGLTLRETGKELNLSAERIRQIEKRALRTLKDPSRTHRVWVFI